MYIVQISDTHLTIDGANAAAREVALARVVAEINAMQPPPLAVVHTGDVAHTGRRGEYEIASRLLASLSVPLYVTVGNRDDREALWQHFPEQARLAAGTPFQQFVVDLGPIRLIAVDTFSFDHGLGEICADRQGLLEAALADIEPPMVVMLHHPPMPMPTLFQASQFRNPAQATALCRTLARQPGLLGVLAGHIHREDVVPLGATHLSTVPSLAVDLRKGRYSGPALRSVIFHRHEIGERGLITRQVLIERGHIPA